MRNYSNYNKNKVGANNAPTETNPFKLGDEEAKKQKDFSLDTVHVDGGLDKFTGNLRADDVEGVNDLRGERQSGLEQLRNGTAKALAKTAIRTADNFLAIPAIIATVAGQSKDLVTGTDTTQWSDLYNNDISKALEDVTNKLTEYLPNYQTDEQKASVGASLTSVNFWADKFLDGASYATAAYLSGLGVTKGLGMAAKALATERMIGNAANTFASGIEAAGALTGEVEAGSGMSSVLKGLVPSNKTLTAAQQVATSIYASATESAAEARGTYDAVRKYKEDEVKRRKQAQGDYTELNEKELKEINDTAVSAGNASFGVNLLLTGAANFIQMGKAFSSRYTNDAIDLARIEGKELGKASVKELNKTQKFFSRYGNTLKDDVLSEAAQEGSQTFTDKFLTDYYTAKPEDTFAFSNAFNNALHETFNTVEGIESIMLGALIGGGMSSVKGIKNKITGGKSEFATKEEALNNAVQMFNKAGVELPANVKKIANSFATSQEINKAKDEAVKEGDRFRYATLQNANMFNIVESSIETGKFNEVVDYFESIKEMTDDQFKKNFDVSVDVDRNKFSDELIENAKNLKKNIEYLKVNYGHKLSNDDIKKIALVSSMKDDFVNREKSIIEKWKNEHGFDYNAVISEKALTSMEVSDKSSFLDAQMKQLSVLDNSYKALTAEVKSITDANIKAAKESDLDTLSKKRATVFEDVQTLSSLFNDSVTDVNYKALFKKLSNNVKNNLEEKAVRDIANGIEDPTRRNEFEKEVSDFKKIIAAKEDVLNTYNKMSNEKTSKEEFNKIANLLNKAKEDNVVNDAFTVRSGKFEKDVDGNDTKTKEDIILDKGVFMGTRVRESYEQWKDQNDHSKGKASAPVDVKNTIINIQDRRIDKDGTAQVLISYDGETAEWENVDTLKYKDLIQLPYDEMNAEQQFFTKYAGREITITIEKGFSYDEAKSIVDANKQNGTGKFTNGSGKNMPTETVKGFMGMNDKGEVTFRTLGEDGKYHLLDNKYLTPVRKKEDGSYDSQYIIPFSFKVNQDSQANFFNGTYYPMSKVVGIASQEDSDNTLFIQSNERYLEHLKKKMESVSGKDSQEAKIKAGIEANLESLKEADNRVKAIVKDIENSTIENVRDWYMLKFLKTELRRINKQIKEVKKANKAQETVLQNMQNEFNFILAAVNNGTSYKEALMQNDIWYRFINNTKQEELSFAEVKKQQAEQFIYDNQTIDQLKFAEKELEKRQTLLEEKLVDFVVNLAGGYDINNNILDSYGVIEKLLNASRTPIQTQSEIKDFILDNYQAIINQLEGQLDDNSAIVAHNEAKKELNKLSKVITTNYDNVVNYFWNLAKNKYEEIPGSVLDGVKGDIDWLRLSSNQLKEFEATKEWAMRDMRREVTSDYIARFNKYEQPFNFFDAQEIKDIDENDLSNMPKPSFNHNGVIDSSSTKEELIGPWLKTVSPVIDSRDLISSNDVGGNTKEQKRNKAEFIFNNLISQRDSKGLLIELVTDLPDDYLPNTDNDTIYTIVTNEQGERLKFDITGKPDENGYYAISVLGAATKQFASGADRFYDLDKQDPELVNQSLEAYKEWRAEQQSQIGIGNKVYMNITSKSFGIRKTGNERNLLSDVTKTNFPVAKDDGSKAFYGGAFSKLHIATGKQIILNDTEYPTQAGRLYYIDEESSKVIPLDVRKLGEKEINSIINGIIHYHNQQGASANSTRTLSELMNDTLGAFLIWGKEKDTTRDRSYEIYFKKNTNNKVVVFEEKVEGGKNVGEITLEEMEKGNTQEFEAFLLRRYHQVDNKRLNGAQSKVKIVYYPTKGYYDGGENAWFNSYEEFLLKPNKNNEDAIATTKMVKGVVNSKTQTVVPQWANSYYRMGKVVKPEKVAKASASKKAKASGTTVTTPGKAYNLDSARDRKEAKKDLGEDNYKILKAAWDNGDRSGIFATQQQEKTEPVEEAVPEKEENKPVVASGSRSLRDKKAKKLAKPDTTKGSAISAFDEPSAPIQNDIFAGTAPIGVVGDGDTNLASFGISINDGTLEISKDDYNNLSESGRNSVNKYNNDVANLLDNAETEAEIETGIAKLTVKLKQELIADEPDFLLYDDELDKQDKIVKADKKFDKTNAEIDSIAKRLKNIYGDKVKLRMVGRLIANKAFGQFKKAGEILLSGDAPIGTNYHEEFHMVLSYYFKPSARKGLFDEWRRVNKQHADMSDKAVEEILAEEFRYYAINEEAKERKNNWLSAIFKDFIDFIITTLSLQRSPKIKNLFEAIYKGELGESTLSYTDALSTGEKDLVYQHLSHAVAKRMVDNEISLINYYGSTIYRDGYNLSIGNNYFRNLEEGFYDSYTDKKFNNPIEMIALDVIDELEDNNEIDDKTLAKIKLNAYSLISEWIVEFKKRNSINDAIDVDLTDSDEKDEENSHVDSTFFNNSNELDYVGKPVEVIRQMLLSIPSGKVNRLGLSESVDVDYYVKKLQDESIGIETWEEFEEILNNGDNVFKELLTRFRESDNVINNPSYTIEEKAGIINNKNRILQQFAKTYLEYITGILEYNDNAFTYKATIENDVANLKGIKKLNESRLNVIIKNSKNDANSMFLSDGSSSSLNVPLIERLYGSVKGGVTKTTLNIFKQLGVNIDEDVLNSMPTSNKDYIITELRNILKNYIEINKKENKPNMFNVKVSKQIGSSINVLFEYQLLEKGKNYNFSFLNAANKTVYAFQQYNTISKKLKRLKDKLNLPNLKLMVLSGLKKGVDDGTVVDYESGETTNRLSDSEMFLSFFNTIMKAKNGMPLIVPYIFPGSKSMTYGISGLTNMKFNASSFDVYKEMLTKEISGIIKAKGELTYAKENGETVVTNYHIKGNTTKGLKNGDGLDLTVFKDIIKSKELLVQIDSFTSEKDIEKLFTGKNKQYFIADIENHVNKKVSELEVFMKEQGIVVETNNRLNINGIDATILNSRPEGTASLETGTYGLSRNNRLNEETKDKFYFLLKDFVVNTEQNLFEQLNNITGVLGYYKDPLKRFTGLMGTKKNINTSPSFISMFNNQLVHLKARKTIRNKDNSAAWNYKDFPMGLDGKARVLVVNDIINEDDVRGSFVAKGNKSKTSAQAYYENNIADAQGYESLEFFRFREIAEGLWGTGAKEAIYKKLINNEEVTKEELEKLLNKNGAYLNTSKTQGYTEFNKFDSNHPMFIKTSVFIPSLVKGTELEKVAQFMGNNGIAILLFESAVKVGRLVDPLTNTGLDLFDRDGRFNGNELIDSERYIQNIDLAFYGTQMDTKNKPKTKTTIGSQERKMIMSNLVNISENGSAEAKEWFNKTKNKINFFEVEKAKLLKQELMEKLGIVETDLGYDFVDKQVVINELIKEGELRDLPKAFSDDIKYLLNNDYSLDIIARKPKLEAVLTSLVNKGIIKGKVTGDSKAQASSAGFTASFSTEDGTITQDINNVYDLQFYPLDKGDNNFVMEVFLPAYLEDKINTNSVINLNYNDFDDPNSQNQLLQILGFRIPTQGLNSIEAIRIKGFLPHYMGNAIVVPKQITAKGGSDFDVDKLNLYFPATYKNKDKESVYINAYTTEEEVKIDYLEYSENTDKAMSYTSYKKLAIDNALLATHIEIFQRPENRLEILTPNTDYDIKGIAKGQENDEYSFANSVRGLRGESPNESRTNMVNQLYLITKKRSFEVGKNTLGQIALHSTHHVLSQLANLKMNLKVFNVPHFKTYLSASNVKNRGRLDLVYDLNGKLISKNIEQYSNAAVDVEKDDYLLDLNVTEETAAVALYLQRLGIPLDEVGLFMSQPCITDYLNQYYKELANNTEKVSKSSAKKLATAYVNRKYGKSSKDEIPYQFDVNNLREGIKSKGGNLTYQKAIFDQFLLHTKAANVLNGFMNVSNYDTAGYTTSFVGNDIRRYKSDMFYNSNKEGNNIDEVTGELVILNTDRFFYQDSQETYLGYFKDITEQANYYFDSLFKINEVMLKLKEHSNIMEAIANSMASTNDKIITSNLVKNELLAYIVLGMNKVSINSRAKELLQGETYVENGIEYKVDAVATQLFKIQTNSVAKGSIGELVQNNYLIQNLVPIIPQQGNQEIYLYDAANTSVERNNKLNDGFRELYDIDPVLTLDIVAQSILQSGFNNSATTIFNIIPSEIVVELIETFYNNPDVNLKDFESQLILNNANKPLLFGRFNKSKGVINVSDDNYQFFKGKDSPDYFGDESYKPTYIIGKNKETGEYHVVDKEALNPTSTVRNYTAKQVFKENNITEMKKQSVADKYKQCS